MTLARTTEFKGIRARSRGVVLKVARSVVPVLAYVHPGEQKQIIVVCVRCYPLQSFVDPVVCYSWYLDPQ